MSKKQWIEYLHRLNVKFINDQINVYGIWVNLIIIPTLLLEDLVNYSLTKDQLIVGLDIFKDSDNIIIGTWRGLNITIFQLTLQFFKKEDLVLLWSETQNENQWFPEKKRKRRIPSIPTIGERGFRFRSQLEAHYANLFTIWKWDWHYEPFALKGYLPDFIISAYSNILVEIKPCDKIRSLHKYKKKILKSGWTDWILILGKKNICLLGSINTPFKQVMISSDGRFLHFI